MGRASKKVEAREEKEINKHRDSYTLKKKEKKDSFIYLFTLLPSQFKMDCHQLHRSYLQRQQIQQQKKPHCHQSPRARRRRQAREQIEDRSEERRVGKEC